MSLESFKEIIKEVKLPITKLVEFGFFYDKDTKKIVCSGGCSFSTPNLEFNSFYELLNKHYNRQVRECKFNPVHLNFIRSITSSKEIKNKKPENFEKENERIRSFNGFESKLDLVEMAKNGFYTLEAVNNINNNIIPVNCYFCGYHCVIFKNRDLNENYQKPQEDHWKKYPDCIMNKDRQCEIGSVGNMILHLNNRINEKENQPIHYNSSDYKNYESIKNVLNKTINLTTEKPHHTEYTLEHQRVESFIHWPSNYPQKPIDLARAGFYYYGSKDCVKCFFCSGVICNWEPVDDPIIEHTRWYPKCSYIKVSKGENFIEKIREMYKDMDSGFTYEYQESNRDDNLVNCKIKMKKRSISPRKINSRMDLPIIQRIIKLKIFERSLVKHVIESKLFEDDNDFENPLDLLKSCYDLKEKSQVPHDKLIEDFHFYVSNVNADITYNTFCEIFKKKFNTSISLIK
jgi:hypothetical protein